MPRLLTTSQIARMYGLADSTIRHYRASGRLRPTRETLGGHARYALADVLSALGEPVELPCTVVEPASWRATAGETFAPTGTHDLRPSGRGEMLAAEAVALASRELPAGPGESAQAARWGGCLLLPRATGAGIGA